MRLHPIVRGATEPYRYEREVEDFLRWSPHVRNPSYRKESRLTPGRDGRAAEGDGELRRPGRVARRRAQSASSRRAGAVARRDARGRAAPRRRKRPAAERTAARSRRRPPPAPPTADRPPRRSARAPAARRRRPSAPPPARPPTEAPQAARGADAPVDHYDDLEADEIVTLLDSLEAADLDALLEYERANRGRPRVVIGDRGCPRAPPSRSTRLISPRVGATPLAKSGGCWE